MIIPFWKMHGAANDFILVDDREETFPTDDHDWIARIASRNTGVGSEGLILIQPSDTADFRMRFFNPDGSEVEMCGNGARCVARLAKDIGAAPAQMSFDTVAGLIRAECKGDQMLLHMMEPKDWRMDQSLAINTQPWLYHSVNTGVPHVVVEVELLDSLDIQSLGSAMRHHGDFAPAGTNVNFYSHTSGNEIRLRTYERGVEAETPACGTGVVAAALVAGRVGKVQSPVHVIPSSGDTLEVGFELTKDGATGVTLLGPAEYVFQGTLEYA